MIILAMPQHTIAIPPDGSMSPKAWYQAHHASPDFVHDAAQAAAIDELDALWHQLMEFKAKRNQFLGRSLLSPDVPHGLYLWGGVGRGKTFLMDAFYACLPYRRKRRIHFHNFMAEVHHEMKLLAESMALVILMKNGVPAVGGRVEDVSVNAVTLPATTSIPLRVAVTPEGLFETMRV